MSTRRIIAVPRGPWIDQAHRVTFADTVARVFAPLTPAPPADPFTDAPDWYWWIVARLVGWRRDVLGWALLFAVGFVAGLAFMGVIR